MAVVLPQVVALAGCGEGRVVLELHGDVAGVTELGVVLAAPDVQIRNQRTNAAPGDKELVAYVAQAAEVLMYPHDPADPIDGFRIQLEASGGDQAFIPIVVAFVGDEQKAIGVHQPEKLFAEDIGAAAIGFGDSNEVRIYGLDLEPVTAIAAADGPVHIPPGGVMEVRCADGELSGAAWRNLKTQQQLRILTGSSAADLHGADLDCDDSTAGIDGLSRGLGDLNDCDDTLASSHGGATTTCNGVDDDCDFRPDLAESSECMITCANTVAVGACDDSVDEINRCPNAKCHACTVATVKDVGDPTQMHVCTGITTLQFNECANGDCVLTLVSATPGFNAKLRAGLVEAGLGGSLKITPDTELELAIESTDLFPVDSPPTSSVTIHIRPEGFDLLPVTYAFELTLSAPEDVCAVPPLTCTSG
ncbi:MAG: putative metal-binding motif-containing protein [Kofleriaceae bacterium]